MALILSIETTTEICSIAISNDGKCIHSIIDREKNAHSSKLIVYIEDAFQKLNLEKASLDAVAVSHGPGSYTGLRIGMSTAKAICYALDKPLISLSTLHALAYGYSEKIDISEKEYFIIPMIDARRMEVFTCILNQNMEDIEPISAKILDENSFSEELNKPCFFIGNGAEKCKDLFGNHPNAHFPDVLASAEHLISMAEIAFQNNDFVNVAYCEPFYLKEYIAGKPNVKGLR